MVIFNMREISPKFENQKYVFLFRGRAGGEKEGEGKALSWRSVEGEAG